MCGLYGVITKNQSSKRQINAIKGLGMLNQARGNHSTGLATIKPKEIIIDKDIKPATEFYKDAEVQTGAFAYIGHTRYATIGGKTQDNAHPYMYGNITGAHNGYIGNYKEHGQYEVDSMALFDLLNKHGNDYHKVTKMLYGQITASWTDGNKIYLMRHNNPLHLAYTDSAVYWSSEYEPLEVVLTTQGIEYKLFSLKNNHVIEIDRKLNERIYEVEFKPYEVKKVDKTYKTTSKTPLYNRYDDYSFGDYDTQYGSYLKDQQDLSLQELQDGGLVDDYMNWSLSEKQDFVKEYGMELLENQPCKVCNKHIDSKTEIFYMNVNDFTPVCRTCLFEVYTFKEREHKYVFVR